VLRVSLLLPYLPIWNVDPNPINQAQYHYNNTWKEADHAVSIGKKIPLAYKVYEPTYPDFVIKY
jgi:hypothetical protein